MKKRSVREKHTEQTPLTESVTGKAATLARVIMTQRFKRDSSAEGSGADHWEESGNSKLQGIYLQNLPRKFSSVTKGKGKHRGEHTQHLNRKITAHNPKAANRCFGPE